MKATNKLTTKIVSVLLCIALLISYMPYMAATAGAAAADITGRVTDPATLNGWKQYFPTSTSSEINTENAGGIWTDKSVMAGTGDINALISGNQKVSMTDSENGLLVALSALGSNMTVSGMAAMPTDTVIILDMSNSIINHVSSMATAANTSLKTLLEANPNNRVAIVSYNSTSSVLLPLGSYTAGRDGNYLTSSTQRISIADGVTNKDTQERVSGSITNSSGTYTQAGIKAAIDQLKARSVTSGRLPVVILLTDGEPTIANTDIANLSGTTMTLNDYSSSYKPGYAFLTQLSMAYLKQVAYPDMLFYTIGVGNGVTDDLMQDVINPDANISDRTLRNYWSTFNDLAANGTMTVGKRSWVLTKTAAMQGLNTDYLSKIQNSQGQLVNGYFPATSRDLAKDIEKAFESVMAEIISKSAYVPTLVQGAAEFSGYISFVDKVGKYMEVDSIKGVVFDDTLHTGAVLASHFTSENSSGGSLKPYAQMSALGKQFIDSVATRLNVDTSTAYTIIQNAWNKGWISYSSSSSYSNWFGWLSNASGGYIGVWDGSYPVTDPNAVFINRSYAMLGTLVNDNDTTDMMFSTIRVRERISTGEQEVNFAIPASLIPTVTYDVSLKEDKTLDSITVTDATPIRLIYEVKLDDAINSLTMLDSVDADYLAANTDQNGNVRFYSNQFDSNFTTGYEKVNTYSYFRPSRQNDRYYYQIDSAVYMNANGTKYVSANTHPKDANGITFFYQHQIYSTTEGVKIGYQALPADIVATAKHNTADNTYTITSGTVRADYAGVGIAKSSNNTGTLPYSHVPFEDTNGAHFDDLTHRMVVGTTLGNNGYITVAPATGFKLTKSMTGDAAVSGSEVFTFKLTSPGLDGTFEAYKATAGGGSAATVTFSSGSATVSLKAGETLSVGGLADGTTVTVEEVETLAHTVHQVLINGNAVSGKTATVNISANTLQAVEFTNGNRSTGTFTVSKIISHELGEDYVIPSNENTRFAVTLELKDFEGKPISGDFTGKYSSKTDAETITFANGVYTATLSHYEQLQINGLPEGSTIKATEQLTAAQQALFNTAKNAVYYENRQATAASYGQVSIAANNTSSIIVENFYAPAQVYPVNIRVEGSKTLTSPDSSVSSFTGGFTFQLQKLVWNGTAYVYEIIDTENGAISVSYNGELGVKEFVFHEAAFANEVYDRAGRYAYRVVEIPTDAALEQGVSFDATVHGFDVEVTDEDMDGKLEIKEIHPARPDSTNEYHETVEGQLWHVISTSFTNHIEQDATETDIEIQKILLDRNGTPIADASGFQFQVADITASMVADGDVLTQEQMDALFANAETSQQTSFSGIARVSKTLNAEGTYFFAVRELKSKGGQAYPTGYSFDSSVKFVKVTVGDNVSGNVLIATAIPAGSAALSGGNYTVSLADGEANGSKPYQATVSFTNTYSPASTFLNIDASKQLIGRPWISSDAQTFTFELTPANDGTHAVSPLYNAQGNAVSRITGAVQIENTGDGAMNTITFGTLLFKEVGTYFYDIRETTATANGITPDATAYGIVVTVTDVNGRLHAEYMVINQESNDSITFVNHYSAGPAKYAVSGSKNFTGGIYYGDDFAFTMTNTADANEVYTATNNTSGIFTFPEITFNTVGTYEYKIEEVIPDDAEKLPGVNYNPEGASYLVTLTVTDGHMGSLVVSSVSHGQNDIVFTNTYTPKGTQAVIGGNKVLVGERVLQAEEFEFALYAATEAWEPASDTPLKTTSNLADGKFEFEPLYYSGMGSVGIHRYLIAEVQGTKGGVSYDTTVYRVAVAVSNDYATGSLSAETYVFSEAAAPLDTIAFTNTYSTSGSITIFGTKVLYGRDQQAGEFAFDIYAVDDSTSTPVGNPIQTAYNNADGSFSFDMGSYTSSGSYFFIIREQNTGVDNVVYDPASYLVQVDLQDDQNGNLVYGQDDVHITRITEEGQAAADSVTFENEFMIYTDVTVQVNKTVINKGLSVMSPEGFEFMLEKVGTEQKLTAKSDANGYAEFVLNFTGRDAGKTYSYKLTEVNTGIENVTYSVAEYYFDVTVDINDMGELVATVTQGDVVIENIVAEFVNEYDYTPPVGPPTGDTSNIHLLFTVLLVSALGILLIALNNDKKNRLS